MPRTCRSGRLSPVERRSGPRGRGGRPGWRSERRLEGALGQLLGLYKGPGGDCAAWRMPQRPANELSVSTSNNPMRGHFICYSGSIQGFS